MMSNTLGDELEKKLKIEKFDLDTELIEFPSVFYQVSENVTTAMAERDHLKDVLGQVSAELDTEIRVDFANEGKKITENQVRSEIETHPNYLKARKNYTDAKVLADQWSTLKEAFSQKSYMLRELVALYAANYYAVDAPVKSSIPSTDHRAESIKRDLKKKRTPLKRAS